MHTRVHGESSCILALCEFAVLCRGVTTGWTEIDLSTRLFNLLASAGREMSALRPGSASHWPCGIFSAQWRE